MLIRLVGIMPFVYSFKGYNIISRKQFADFISQCTFKGKRHIVDIIDVNIGSILSERNLLVGHGYVLIK